MWGRRYNALALTFAVVCNVCAAVNTNNVNASVDGSITEVIDGSKKNQSGNQFITVAEIDLKLIFLESLDDPFYVKGCNITSWCDVEDLEDSRHCDDQTATSWFPGESDWMHLRAAYIAVVDDDECSLEEELTFDSGFRVPYAISISDDKGRGVYATEDLPNGTLIWQGEYTAEFRDEEDFRMFLSVLPDRYVCDLLEWCYVEFFEDEEYHYIGCDLDSGSLINHANNDAEYNAGHKGGWKTALFATRDIKAGEELLTSYDEFDVTTCEDFHLFDQKNPLLRSIEKGFERSVSMVSSIAKWIPATLRRFRR